jgi:predicted tellurium resistance membrane protein TerC
MSADLIVAFITLTSLEVVLGIDNILFIAIVASKLPEQQRERARIIGLSLAVFTRILLLLSLSWLIGLSEPFMTILGKDISAKDLILIGGGLFLIAKATKEIHHKIESPHDSSVEQSVVSKVPNFWSIISQILLIDIIFSLDSVITAVGMVNSIPVMISAIIASILIMLLCSKVIVDFINKNPAIKILALSFLLLIGVLLLAEGFHQEFNRGYIYFAIGFSLAVEFLNMKMRKNIL